MKKSKLYFLLAVIGLLLNACTYDFILKEELPPPIDPNVDVLFSTQIAPIFTNSGCIACHKTGGQAPDLSTAATAYSNIKSMNLVNTAAAETSPLYNYPNPASTIHTWKKYSAAEAQLVLTWIQQGAKNN